MRQKLAKLDSEFDHFLKYDTKKPRQRQRVLDFLKERESGQYLRQIQKEVFIMEINKVYRVP